MGLFCHYFTILIWKNRKIKCRHKLALIIEFLIPIFLACMMVYIRKKYEPKFIEKTIQFKPFSSLDTLPAKDSNLTFDRSKIAYAPDTVVYRKLLTNVAERLNFNLKGLKDANELENYMMKKKLFYGIVFDKVGKQLSDALSYTIRVPPLNVGRNQTFGWQTKLLHFKKHHQGPRDGFMNIDGLNGYIKHGLIAIQHATALSFLKLLAENKNQTEGSSVAMSSIKLQRFPYFSHVVDDSMKLWHWLLPFIIILCFIFSACQLAKLLTSEKEDHLKEGLQIMGVKPTYYWSSWFFSAFCVMIMIVVLLVCFLKINLINSTATLHNTSWGIILILLICYICSVITFTFMISAFFSTQSIATNVTALLFIIFYIPYLLSSINHKSDKSWIFQISSSLLMNSAIGYGFGTIIYWEMHQEGAQFSNVRESPRATTELPLGIVMLMLLIDTFLYLLIALYIEKVYPGKYGMSYKWYFPLMPSFWSKKKRSEIDSIFEAKEPIANVEWDSNRFEADPLNLRRIVGIQIVNLTKRFGKVIAVDNLCMDAYQNDITVLLGHDDSGKTTTISMIIGFLKPDDGIIIVRGKNVSEHMLKVRRLIGVCPQHNILFDDLTVREHIIFYGRIRGLNSKRIAGETEKYLKILQLENEENEMAENLTNGMKKKLSLAVALCGGSKVILCDEPSNGVEPEDRKLLWHLLELEKKKRTILLTTSSMDEADILGDRIVIMSAGRVIGCGTSSFLKRNFGEGYLLTCRKTVGCDSEKVTNLIHNYIPEAKFKSETKNEIAYEMKENLTQKFESLLITLEESLESLGLENYRITSSTLEDVFLRTGSKLFAEYENSTIEHLDFGTDVVRPCTRYRYQWEAMFRKKIFWSIRNWSIWLLQIFIPLLVMIVQFEDLRQSSDETLDLPKLTLTLDTYGVTRTILQTTPGSNIGTTYRDMFGKWMDQFVRSVKIEVSEAINELEQTSWVFNNNYSNFLIAATIKDNESVAWYNHEAFHTAPLSLNLMHNAILNTLFGENSGINLSIHPLPYNVKQKFILGETVSVGYRLAINLGFGLSVTTALSAFMVVTERITRAKLLQMMSGVSVFTFWLVHLVIDMIPYLIVAAFVIAILKAYRIEHYQSSESIGTFFLIFLLYGLSSLSLTYLLSYIWSDAMETIAKVFIINILLGFTFFLVIKFFREYSYELGLVVSRSIFLLLPVYAFMEGVMHHNDHYVQQKFCMELGDEFEVKNFSNEISCELNLYMWNYPGIGLTLIFFACTAIGYLLVLLIFEANAQRLRYLKNICRSKHPRPRENIEEAVQKEKDRVINMSRNEINQQVLVMRRLTKFYGRSLAVNQLSAAVGWGECFAFLGAHGAGKTTIFRLLTGEENISYGDAFNNGHNIKTQQYKARQLIGYCQQFNSLLDDLTGYQMLKIFCLIRGIPRKLIHSMILRLSQQLAFSESLHKPIKDYSCGNKRKVSTVIAFLGDPPIVLLNEPTTGIDPSSRRQLWNMIRAARNTGRGIIMASHNMEECETLCTRMAIIINGELKCIGTIEDLRDKFSKGISLHVKLKRVERVPLIGTNLFIEEEINENRVIEFITSNFEEATLKERRVRLLTFEIASKSTPYSRIFGIMELKKVELNIDDYWVTQTSLEQIFFRFSQEQEGQY